VYDLIPAHDKTPRWRSQFEPLPAMDNWVPDMIEVHAAKPTEDILAPVINKPPAGRPVGKRLPGALERAQGAPPAKRGGQVHRCTKCGWTGHKAPTCGQKGAQTGRELRLMND